MSFLSKKKIYCPDSIKFEIKSINKHYDVIWVSGEYATWFYKIDRRKHILYIHGKTLFIETSLHTNTIKQYFTGLQKYSLPKINSELSLLAIGIRKMIVGAGVGFKKYLRVRGVGYKFEIENESLIAKVGYTHSLNKSMPYEFTTKFSRKSKVLRFRSKSLTKLTGFLSSYRGLRKPDIYKGKGIRYKRDPVRRKPGKRKTRAVSKKKKSKFKHTLLKKVTKRKISRKKRIKKFEFRSVYKK